MIYEVISDVTIRKGKTPSVSNPQVGLFEAGTQGITVYSTFVDSNNVLWARVSEPDATGSSQWVCIKNTNRTFMKIVDLTSNSNDLIEVYVNHNLVYTNQK